MPESMDKPCVRFRKVLLVLLPVLYLSGIMIGSFLTLVQPFDLQTQSVWLLSGLFRSANSGFLSVFSGFLFDFIPVSLAIALLGMTFLGPMAIPGVVLYKGIQQGIILAVYFSDNIQTQISHGWISYIPTAALASMAFLLFSIQICASSIRFPLALFLQNRIEVPVKPYFRQIFVMLITFTAIAFLQAAVCIWIPNLF